MTRKQNSGSFLLGVKPEGDRFGAAQPSCHPDKENLSEESLQRKRNLEKGRNQLVHNDTMKLLDQTVSDDGLVMDLAINKS